MSRKAESERILVLDSLRGVAAILVFIFHCSLGYKTIKSDFLNLGVTGVDLFFMISGFVIILSLEKTKKSIAFLIKRFMKLFPVYWFIVSFTTLLILINEYNIKISNLLVNYLGNLTMIQRYFKIPNLDEQYWTLEVELAFYLFIYVVFLFKKLKSIEIIGLVFLTLIVLYDLFLENLFPLNLYFILFNHFPLFFSGIIFYKIKTEGGQIYRYVLLILCFCTTCMLFNNGGRSMYYISFFNYFLMTCIYFIVFLFLTFNRLGFLLIKPLLFMGRISYSFYLIHQYLSSKIIIPKLQQLFSINFSIGLFVAFSVNIFLAYLITKYIEEPCTNYGKKIIKKSKFS